MLDLRRPRIRTGASSSNGISLVNLLLLTLVLAISVVMIGWIAFLYVSTSTTTEDPFRATREGARVPPSALSIEKTMPLAQLTETTADRFHHDIHPADDDNVPGCSREAKILPFQSWSASLGIHHPAGGSQYFQDETIYKLVYADELNGNPCKMGARFVEFGASDAWFHSNSLFFEKAFGWEGFMVEGDPELVARGRRRRRADIVEGVVCDKPGTVNFERSPIIGLSGIVSSENGGPLFGGGEHLRGEKPQVITAKCHTLESLLASHGVREGDNVQLLSVDVEGFEVPVLKPFPWHKYRVMVVMVEVVKPGSAKVVREMMLATGLYREPYRIDPEHPDDIYVRRDVRVHDHKSFQVACEERCRTIAQCLESGPVEAKCTREN